MKKKPARKVKQIKDIISNKKRVGWGMCLQKFDTFNVWQLNFTLGTGAVIYAIEGRDKIILYTFADKHGAHRAVISIHPTTLHVDVFEPIESVNELQNAFERLVVFSNIGKQNLEPE